MICGAETSAPPARLLPDVAADRQRTGRPLGAICCLPEVRSDSLRRKSGGRMKLIALMVCVVAFSNSAHAAPSCADYEKVIAASANAFRSLRARERADGAYDSNFQLPGAGRCLLGEVSGVAAFACRRPFLSKADAQKGYETVAADIRVCFPSWPENPAEHVPDDRFTANEGISLLGPDGVSVGVLQFRESGGLLDLEWVAISFMRTPPESVS